jgi:serine/threonine-protein kinase RsbW
MVPIGFGTATGAPTVDTRETTPMDPAGNMPVRLRVPAHPQYLRLVRLVASSMAGDLGFPLEELDEVRIAVDEVGAALLVEDAATELHFTFSVSDDALTVRAASTASSETLLTLDPIAEEMIRILTDKFEVTCQDREHRITIVRALRSERS